MSVGDFLTNEQRAEYIRTRLVPGQIIHATLHFDGGPKPKFLLVARVGAETEGFVINSKIPPFIQSRRHLLDAQVSIDQASHTFLEYDSHIDCSKVQYEDTEFLRLELIGDVTGIKQNVSDQVRAEVIRVIRESVTIERVVKLQLLGALSPPDPSVEAQGL